MDQCFPCVFGKTKTGGFENESVLCPQSRTHSVAGSHHFKEFSDATVGGGGGGGGKRRVKIRIY